MDCRICHDLPQNFVRYGARTEQMIFHPLLQNLFKTYITDPTPWLSKGFNRNNLCVPACIVLAILDKLGQWPRTLTTHNLEDMIRLLPYESLLTPLAKGLALNQLSTLEDLMHPIPQEMLQRWPALGLFSGISINLYSMQRRGTEFRIFPNSISRFSRNSEFLQCDLLVSNRHIQPESTANKKEKEIASETLHTLVIKKITYFLSKYSSKAANYSRYKYSCRTCLKNFVSQKLLRNHHQICKEMNRGVVGKRRTTNKLIHHPVFKNKFSGKWFRNGLRFKRKDVGKLLRPIMMSLGDFESYHSTIDTNRFGDTHFEDPPSTAETYQRPMAYAWAHKSLYPQYELPQSLAESRVLFLSETELEPEKTFFLSIFLQMRKDLLLYHNWVQEILHLDQGPPNVRYASAEDIARFRSTKSCQLCGLFFGQKLFSEKSKKFYHVKRCWDHGNDQ